MKKKAQLMTKQEVMRALKRIAHQITERNEGVENLLILGIARGGIGLANILADYLERIEGSLVPCGVLDISAYRDDRALAQGNGNEKRGANEKENGRGADGAEELSLNQGASVIPVPITGENVVLVDDVLYTGRTARAAFDALSDLGRAATIQLAVLIDRGHRELPIRADYVGKNIPTAHTETVRVEREEGRADVSAARGIAAETVPFAGKDGASPEDVIPVVNIYDL